MTTLAGQRFSGESSLPPASTSSAVCSLAPCGPADRVLILQGVWKGTCGFSFMEVTECQREEVNALERRIYYLHHLREGGTPHHAGHRATTSVGQEAERSQRKAWTGTSLGLPREAQCVAALNNVGGLWGSL